MRTGLDEVVVRRRERRFERGSEVAVFPGHGPMLVRVAECDVRLTAGGRASWVHIGDGFVEVRNDRVKVLTSFARFGRVEPSGVLTRQSE
jgi:F0F1-type ATP synthase epsilon subunit